jgi:hypothetical protein
LSRPWCEHIYYSNGNFELSNLTKACNNGRLRLIEQSIYVLMWVGKGTCSRQQKEGHFRRWQLLVRKTHSLQSAPTQKILKHNERTKAFLSFCPSFAYSGQLKINGHLSIVMTNLRKETNNTFSFETIFSHFIFGFSAENFWLQMNHKKSVSIMGSTKRKNIPHSLPPIPNSAVNII